MKRSDPEQHFGFVPLRKIRSQLKLCCHVAVVSITGCTSSQVRYDATRMREDVMVYYNDQIMDNLIKAKNKEPFVHVDISLISSQGSSQITGTIGDGETTTSSVRTKFLPRSLGSLARLQIWLRGLSDIPSRRNGVKRYLSRPLQLSALRPPCHRCLRHLPPDHQRQRRVK